MGRGKFTLTAAFEPAGDQPRAIASLIEGIMGSVSQAVLCALVLAAAAKVILDVRVPAAIRRLARRNGDRRSV